MKIMIAGNYGAANIGDEMILEGLVEILKESTTEASISVLSANPDFTRKFHKVTAHSPFPAGFRSLLKSIVFRNSDSTLSLKESDLFILGGGNLFAGPEPKANLIWGLQADKAIKNEIPLYNLGQSLGPIKDRKVQKVVKHVFENSELTIFRDQLSKLELEKFHLKKEAYVYPDFAFAIPLIESNIKRKKKLLIALRYMPNLSEELIENLSMLANSLTAKGWQIECIDFKKGEQYDNVLHKKLIAKISDKSKIKHIEYIESSSELFNSYQEAELVIGMRLHSIITAIKTKTPFIAINYAAKVEAIVTQYQMQNYLIDLNAKNIIEKYKLFEKNKSEIHIHLTDTMSSIKEELKELSKLLHHKLKLISDKSHQS